MDIAFFHPDLGIGGAERLIVDTAAVLAKEKKNHVTIFTNYYDPRRCFEEARTGLSPHDAPLSSSLSF